MNVDLPERPRISASAFLAFSWAGVAVASCLVCFRLIVRCKTFKRLYWDDACIVVAWLIFIATTVTWQLQIHNLYLLYDLADGTLPMTEKIIERLQSSMHAQLATSTLFYIGLWLIKLSFLIFFRRLFDRVQKIKIWWWVVLFLVLASYIPIPATHPYRCMGGDFLHTPASCHSDSTIATQMAATQYYVIADVVTDMLIMSIPIIVLYNSRIPLKQKLALMATFSLTIFIMITATIRIAIQSNGALWDLSWCWFLINLEMMTALIVACTASFRQLFIKSERHTRDGYRSSVLSRIRDKLLGSVRSTSSESDTERGSPSFGNTPKGQKSSNKYASIHSSERGSLSEKILVTHEVEVKDNVAVPSPVLDIRSSWVRGLSAVSNVKSDRDEIR